MRRSAVPDWVSKSRPVGAPTRWTAVARNPDALEAEWYEVASASSAAEIAASIALAELPTGEAVRVRAKGGPSVLLLVAPDGALRAVPETATPRATSDCLAPLPTPAVISCYDLPSVWGAAEFWSRTPHRDFVDFWERADKASMLASVLDQGHRFVVRFAVALASGLTTPEAAQAVDILARWAERAGPRDAPTPATLEALAALKIDGGYGPPSCSHVVRGLLGTRTGAERADAARVVRERVRLSEALSPYTW